MSKSLAAFSSAIGLLCSPLWGQNLDAIGKGDALSVSGGVAINQIVYAMSGMEQRRQPYSFYASGNLSLSLYGWSVPLSFSYSNQQFSFQQPFNQYSLHPTYKWITGHFGYNSMSFSPYTLAGHTFLGAGIDANPGNWNVSAMYGRLLKAVVPDSTAGTENDAAFQRMGYGFKAGYNQSGHQVHLIVFAAEDDPTSIPIIPETNELLPQQNLVVSLGGATQLFSSLTLNAEYAISGITRDIRSPESTGNNAYSFFGIWGPVYTQRVTSAYYDAFKSGLTYQGKAFSVGAAYERIDPGYRTLGAYYFNNDLENTTLNGATAFWGGRINVSGNVGRQRDDLNEEKTSSLRRTVGSINVGVAASERVNISGSYSNFTTFTNIRSQFVDINQLTPFDNLDTLNFTQISQNASLNASFVLSAAEESRQNLSVSMSFQDAADEQGGVEQASGSQFYTANAAYSVSLPAQNLNGSASMNYNQNIAGETTTITLGPTVSASTSFFEKQLRTSLSTSWNASISESTLLNPVFNVRGNASYTLLEKHNLNLSLAVVNRSGSSESGAQAFSEFTGTLGYSYNFSWTPQFKKANAN
ncbi:MAG: hypothetical protein AAFQ98_22660 [Bacteroidota bacterium]